MTSRTPSFSAGSANFQTSSTKFRDYAAYAQATYNLTDKLKFTAGFRYTWDKQESEIHLVTVNPITQRTEAEWGSCEDFN